MRAVNIPNVSPWRRLYLGGAFLAAVLIVGTSGYMAIEGWSFLDALYMTVTSVTTVGFREVQPLSDGGRVFTIFVILFGVGTVFYLLTAAVAGVVEGELGAALGVRRMQQRIERLADHYILWGYGRVGQEIARDFVARGDPLRHSPPCGCRLPGPGPLTCSASLLLTLGIALIGDAASRSELPAPSATRSWRMGRREPREMLDVTVRQSKAPVIVTHKGSHTSECLAHRAVGRVLPFSEQMRAERARDHNRGPAGDREVCNPSPRRSPWRTGCAAPLRGDQTTGGLASLDW